MPVFFVPSECIAPPAITIPSNLLVHLRDSLRVQEGEIVLIGDGAGSRYRTQITALTKYTMTGQIIEVMTQPPSDSPALILGQALLKGDKMDWVIQKATELGVQHVLPLQTRHTIVQLRPERIEAQLTRWQRIALEAAQQSEQWQVPTIAQPQSLATLLKNQAISAATFMLAERQEGQGLQAVELPQAPSSSVLVLIGPEGGWSQEEVELAIQAGCQSITLGQSILRAETAAIAAISILQSRLGKLG